MTASQEPGAQRFQDILTEGRLAPPVAGEPVTKLALRREFAPSPGFPVDVDWAALPGSDSLLANLDRLLRVLREIVGEVCADDMGRQAWAQVRTLRLAHRPGAELSVRQEPEGLGLSVQADLAAALPRDLAGELRRKLSAVC